jgi:hypothetical protein
MVKLILATDMAKHKELTDQFQKCLNGFNFKNKEHLEIVKFLKIIRIFLQKNKLNLNLSLR